MVKDNTELIIFTSTERIDWLNVITSEYERLGKLVGTPSLHKICIDFAEGICPNDIKPFHLVTLACLINYLKDSGLDVSILENNKRISHYIYYDLGFSEYWSKGKNHVEASEHDRIFNLWRIVESEKDLYAKQVENYLRKTYFKDRDLSAVSVGLVEAYYNVFDHAQANGNAFSIIQFDEKTSLLQVAISDFGIGIAKSVCDYDKSVTNDKDAIRKALEDNFTVKSTKRNRGMGLGYILAPAQEARIFSHKGLVYKHDSVIEEFDSDMFYPGTLIYYEIDLSRMEIEEVMNEFDLFD